MGGNQQKMREALEEILRYLEPICKHAKPKGEQPTALFAAAETVRDMVVKALSAPARQCDVGTAEEQSERMEKAVCSKHHGCVRCPLRKAKYSDCSLGWAQTPYAEEGAGK